MNGMSLVINNMYKRSSFRIIRNVKNTDRNVSKYDRAANGDVTIYRK